jgi:hypothetical protein
MPLLSIVYVSAARPDFHGPALTAMIDLAKVRNASLDITGCLLHYDGSFMQVLEGPADNVLQVYRSIRADPRHHRLVELHHAELAQRAFSDWSMQLAQPGEAAWNALYRMALGRTDVDAVPVLRPLLSSFLISGDRYQVFRA